MRKVSSRLEIENFLDISLPENILMDGDAALFDSSDLEELVEERPPFLLISKAVSLGNKRMLGIAHLTVEQCKGHFPKRPIVPLIRMCEATAQAGIILVALNTSKDQVPIAVGSGPSNAITHEFVEPPATLLIEVTKDKEKFGSFFVISGRIYVKGEKIAELSGIKCLVPHKDKVFPKTPVV